MTNSFELISTVQIAAPPTLVFEFFTNPELLERWQCVHADCDPRPGGALVLNVTGTETTRGEFIVVDPPHRLVFTWGFEQAGNTQVEVCFSEKDGGTLVRVSHRGFATVTAKDSHNAGWDHYLGRLQCAASGSDPGPDSWRKQPPRTVSGASQ